ncbi:choice-of-anchor L domain-containing protein [Candidatus Thiothrix sp. Deng01]|uniref:Choice-of-anchor L domain-containing protein n=1 Tax=Candidatus Thiothrix phosphatis TaxID=3112415 RepID=A0ABU6D048_9GAMM|nr:choice-of-anchor L domain-containing protein [Candidatus Thiothrix sp. Deng01]MEB4592206.1 choice-of-anchor L domain-containing protein [Candidatus Thiothrix sp. Deng01]
MIISALARGAPLLLFLFAASVQADVLYNPNASAAQISSVLDGPGLSVSNLAVTHGVTQQFGVFTGGKAIVGVEAGVFVDTGNVGSLQGPNISAAYSHNTGVVYADPDLTRLSSNAKYDPAIIEFDIVPQGDRVNFVFAFGSDEYPEYVCSRFNDAFGLFVSGPGLNGVRNAAFMPESGDAIAVNNVNGGSPGSQADGTSCNLKNTAYFVDNGNGGGSALTQLDGYTKPITASLAGLTAGQSYHIKLALADAGDPAYDSGALFKWLTSTKSEPVDLSLQASASISSPAWNSEVEISYTVKNSSSASTSLVQVGLEWPAGLAWVNDDSNGSYNASTGLWDAGTIPANGSKTLKIRGKVGTASSYTISGEIQFAFNEDPDSTPFNRSSHPGEDDTASVSLYPVDKPANQPPDITSNGGNATAYVLVDEEQTAVTTVKAVDPEGQAITYRITGGADAARFSINATTGVLTFVSAPDYEAPTDADKNNFYEVKVTASDGNLSDTQTLTVQINNIKENTAPVITSDGGGATANISMNENLTSVTKVTATDANGDTLKFSISGGDDADMFSITSGTGRLTFIAAPDYEKPGDNNKDNVYQVEVTVSDGSLSDTQLINVQMLNVAEGSAPKITSNGGGATANISVPENQQAVTTVTASVSGGTAIVYRLGTTADESLFQINTNSGKLAFIKPPDYENPKDANQDNIYIVTVIAGGGEFESSQLLFVTVTDVKENTAPTIISDSGGTASTLSVPENQRLATVVTATDADGDPVTYSISGGADAALFQISSGGTLSFAVAPDYEKPQDGNKDNIYVVTVSASDGSQAVTQTLNIVVSDVFENLPPVISSNGGAATASIDVPENQAMVTVVSASDPNGDVVTYSISGGEDAALFKINATSGLLEFIAAPDYEKPQDGNKDNIYTVIVKAADNGGLNITQTLTINVQNLDDIPYVNIKVRVFLQGVYSSTTKRMSSQLHSMNLLPTLQPYGELKTAFGYAASSDILSPFDYKGTETAAASVLAATGENAPIDWVLVELRDALDPSKRRAAAAGLLQSNGDVVDAATGSPVLPIMNAADGLYYVMVRHRNHLAVTTATPVSISRGNPLTVDFTLSATRTYGSDARLESNGVSLMWVGDTNNSNTIIANGPGSDSSVLLGAVLVAPENKAVNTSYKLRGYYSTDFNQDGMTVYTGPGNDINLLLGNILLHPGNTTFSANFIVRGGSPL